MALTKISTAMISQSASAVDLNIDAGTLYVDATNNRVGVGGKTDPATPLHVTGTVTATLFAGSGASLTSIPNGALTNSSITINSSATSLGGSITLTTANIAENTNLYYTNARADARIAAADTNDLSEGSSNLYYTDARVNARVAGGSLGNITTTGYIRGPATFTIDPATHGDNTGTVVIAGNLQVDGTQTTINSTTLTVDDKNITLASGSANASAASGAGFTVDIGSGTNPSIIYDGTNDEWDFNKPLNVTGAITTNSGVDVTGNIAVSGTVDGIDIAARDAVLTSTTTTAGAALPKAGGTMTGGLSMNGSSMTFDSTNDYMEFNKALFSPIGYFVGTTGTKVGLIKNASGVMNLEATTGRQISFGNATNGEHVRIDADGNVGIGIAAPLAKLHVDTPGTTAVSLTGGAAAGQIFTNENFEFAFGLHSSSPYPLYIQGRTADSGTTTARDIVLNPLGGKVGIGITAPGYPLEVAGASSTSIAYQRTGVSAKKWGFHTDNDNTYWQNITDSVLALTIKNNGNVGIGTTSPDEKLHVVGQGSFEGAGNTNRGNLILGAHGSGSAKWAVLAATSFNDATGSGNGSAAAGNMLIGGYSDASGNTVYIGGGPYEVNPATGISFNTHSATTHTAGGTTRMTINSSGDINMSGSLSVAGILRTESSHAANGVGDLRVIPSTNSSAGVGFAGQVLGVNISSTLSSNAPKQDNTWGGVTGSTAIALQADDNSYGQFQVWTAPQDSSANTVLTPRFWIAGNGAATFAGNLNVTGTVQADNLTMLDSEYIRLGNSNDLQIFHDGNHSMIQDLVGTGALKIKSNDTRLEDADGNNIIKATSTAAELYFSGSKKLETNSEGVVVTGTVTAMGLNAPYNTLGQTGSGAMLILGHNAVVASGSNIVKAKNTGYHSTFIKMYYNQGITFHSTAGTQTAGTELMNGTGANSLEHMRMTNAGKLGIGTPNPNLKLHVEEDTDTWVGEFKNTRSAGGYGLRIDNSGAGSATDARYALGVYTPGNSGFFVRNNGNVGIGTAAPGYPLHIRRNAAVNTTVELLRLDCGDTTHVGGKAGTIKFTDISVYNPTAEITAARIGVSSASKLEFKLRSYETMVLHNNGHTQHGPDGVRTAYFSGYSQGTSTFSHDIVHDSDAGQGTVLHIQAAFTHHPSYDCILDTWVSRRQNTVTRSDQFRRDTSVSGGFQVAHVSNTITRITKTAGTYVGGGPYWIKATWRNA